MTTLKISDMIEYYNNDELSKIVADDKFDPNDMIKTKNKDFIFIAIYYNNYEAFEMLVTHKNFKKKDINFVHRIMTRIIKHDCYENRKYLDLLFEIGFEFDKRHLHCVISNNMLFINIFNRIVSNKNSDETYEIIKDILYNIFRKNDASYNNIVEFLYNSLKSNCNEKFTKENIDKLILETALNNNNIYLVDMIKNDFDILLCRNKPSIVYALNKDTTLLHKLCKMKIESNTKYNSNLISDLDISIIIYTNSPLSYRSSSVCIETFLLIAKNYNLLKQCYRDISDNIDNNMIYRIVSLLYKYIIRYGRNPKFDKQILECTNLIEFLFQNKITIINPFILIDINFFETFIPNMSRNYNSINNVNIIKVFRDIFLIFMKYNYKPENNNMLKHFFKEEELDTLDSLIDKNIIAIDMEDKKKPKRKTVVKKVNIII
jgi:hypothetical protein